NLTMTVALVVVVAISLSLLGTGLLFVKQVDNTRTYWQGRVQLSIFLCTATSVSAQCKQSGPATQAQRDQILHDLTALRSQGVEQVYYESQAQAFARFKKDFAQDRSFASLVTQGEIPDSFQVKLRNAQSDYNVVAGAVERRPGERRHRRRDHPGHRGYPAGREHHPAVRVQPPPGDQHHAPGRRVQLLRAATISARRSHRRIVRLAHRSRIADRGQDAGPGHAPAVLSVQRAAQRRRPRRGHRSGHGHGSCALWRHILPHPQALPSRVTPADARPVASRQQTTVIARNRRARYDYHIEDEFEGGLVLTGTEVKSLRAGRASLTDGFAQITDGEMWLHGVHIPEYAQGTWTNHEPRRPRKVLLHRREIDRLARQTAE